MKKSTLLALICILCVGSAYATGRKVFKVKQLESQKNRVEQVIPALKFVPQDFNSTSKFAPAADPTVPVSEDFSKFTAGSEAEPDAVEISDPTTGEISADYTLQPGWIGAGIYQAGGVAYVGMFEGMYGPETGFLNTPVADLSDNSGTFSVKFRARSTSAEGDEMVVLLQVYDDSRGSYSTVKSTSIPITNEWGSYEVPMNLGTDDAYVQFYAMLYEYYVDDFQIVMEGLQAPVNLNVTNYKETSATLNWDAVEGADSYLVNVYYFDSSAYDYVYVIEDESVTTNSYDVEGLDSSFGYYFDVRTVQGERVSANSEAVAIQSNIDGPDGLSCENYTGTSFTAKWNAVEGAASYLLDVYSFIEDGWDMIYVPFLEGQEVTGTTYEVTGLEAGTAYYFSVKAKMPDGTISKPSAEQAVLPTVDAPVATNATEVTENGFVANWNTVDFGEVYLPNLYKEHTAEAEEDYVIADADFDMIESEGTLEEPETTFQGVSFDASTGAYGWYISMPAYMTGAVGLDNSWAAFFGPSFMYSPEYDLSSVGGVATLNISVASADATSLVVSLATLDDEGYLHEIEMSGETIQVTPKMTDNSVVLLRGTESCYVLIYALDGTYVMIDKLQMSVQMKTGDKFEYIIDGGVVEGETSYAFSNISAGDTDRVSYDVSAVYVGDGSSLVYSDVSNRVYVDLPTSLADVQKADATAFVEDGMLNVVNPMGEAVKVYTVSGMQVLTDDSGAERLQKDLPGRGVYLVEIGNRVIKVVK